MICAAALVGSWALERAEVVEGGAVTDAAPFGRPPAGVLHYLPDGRMAVLIAHADRRRVAGGRIDGSVDDRLAAARSFTAYAGRYDVEDDRVVHHVDINSFPNDVGVDYVRLATLAGDVLDLATPPDLPTDQRPMRLRWRRM